MYLNLPKKIECPLTHAYKQYSMVTTAALQKHVRNTKCANDIILLHSIILQQVGGGISSPMSIKNVLPRYNAGLGASRLC